MPGRLHRPASASPQLRSLLRKMVGAFEEGERHGLGIISLEGKMIDAANAGQADDPIARAEAIAQQKKE